MAQTFSTKDPEEQIILSVSFANVFEIDETIIPDSVDITFEDPSEIPDPTMLVGSPDITDDPIVKFIVKYGVGCVTYVVRVKVETSLGRTLVGKVELPVSRAV